MHQSAGGDDHAEGWLLLGLFDAAAIHHNEIHARRTEPDQQRHISSDNDRPGEQTDPKLGYHSDGGARICGTRADEVMRAWLLESLGGLEKLKPADAPDPRAGANEVVLRVLYAGLN